MIGPPVAIVPIRQTGEADCAIAALAMLLGKTYGEVAPIVTEVAPKALQRGLWVTEMQRVVRKLGGVLRVSRTFNLDEDVGLLMIDLEDSGHVVVLFRGVLINPGDGCVWEPDAYLAKSAAKPRSLLTLAV